MSAPTIKGRLIKYTEVVAYVGAIVDKNGHVVVTDDEGKPVAQKTISKSSFNAQG